MSNHIKRIISALEREESDMETEEEMEEHVGMDELPEPPKKDHLETEKEALSSYRPRERPLESVLDDFNFSDPTREDFLQLFSSWNKATTVVQKMFHEKHLFDQTSLKLRNQSWARQYLALATEKRFGNKRILGIHGLGHFVGPQGLVSIMSDQGWSWQMYDYDEKRFTPFMASD